MTEPGDACVEIGRLAATVDAIGCTDEEVARVSADQGRALPPLYRCFLKAMGRDGGGLFDGALVSYPYVLGFRDAAINLLRDDSEDCPDVFALPDDAVVISMHDQGYAFQFIRASMGDDAPVEMWSEGFAMDRAEIVFSSVLDWVWRAFTRATVPAHDSGRRHLQALLRRAFDPPSCPVCGADWSSYGEVQTLPNLSRVNNATLVTCRSCQRRFNWWWGETQPIDAP